MVEPELNPFHPFPQDVERLIFERALQNNFKDITNLLVVARRVHEWIIPEAFKTVILTTGLRFPLLPFTLSDFERYGKHIRNLYISKGGITHTSRSTTLIQKEFVQCLSLCPNLTNLVIVSRPPLALDLLAICTSFPLTRLSIHLESLLDLLADTPMYSINNGSPRPLFLGVTHLQSTFSATGTYGTHQSPARSSLIMRTLAHHFPNITHFATYKPGTPKELPELVLASCKSLKVYVLWEFGDLGVVNVREDRVFEMSGSFSREWVENARGRGMDMWDMAERFVAQGLGVTVPVVSAIGTGDLV